MRRESLFDNRGGSGDERDAGHLGRAWPGVSLEVIETFIALGSGGETALVEGRQARSGGDMLTFPEGARRDL
jgi:hypothetical protein